MGKEDSEGCIGRHRASLMRLSSRIDCAAASAAAAAGSKIIAKKQTKQNRLTINHEWHG
jgi:hypothetical protein